VPVYARHVQRGALSGATVAADVRQRQVELLGEPADELEVSAPARAGERVAAARDDVVAAQVERLDEPPHNLGLAMVARAHEQRPARARAQYFGQAEPIRQPLSCSESFLGWGGVRTRRFAQPCQCGVTVERDHVRHFRAEPRDEPLHGVEVPAVAQRVQVGNNNAQREFGRRGRFHGGQVAFSTRRVKFLHRMFGSKRF
jgi:hypothetical protein